MWEGAEACAEACNRHVDVVSPLSSPAELPESPDSAWQPESWLRAVILSSWTAARRSFLARRREEAKLRITVGPHSRASGAASNVCCTSTSAFLRTEMVLAQRSARPFELRISAFALLALATTSPLTGPSSSTTTMSYSKAYDIPESPLNTGDETELHPPSYSEDPHSSEPPRDIKGSSSVIEDDQQDSTVLQPFRLVREPHRFARGEHRPSYSLDAAGNVSS